jgi:hypothetical protein
MAHPGAALQPSAWLESGFTAFDALAAGVALWRLSEAPAVPARPRDIVGLLILCILGGLTSHAAAPAALTVLAFLLWRAGEVQARAAGATLLALASHQLWSPLIFKIAAPELIRIDAAMVGELVSKGTPGAHWRDNIISVPSGHAIAVLEGCSSFTNVSAALLAWVALAKLERVGWVRSDLLVGLAAGLAQVLLNVGRLILMAQSYPLYLYWHEGDGKQIYVMTASAAAVLIGVFGTRWAARR